MTDHSSRPITVHMLEHYEFGFGEISAEDREACANVLGAFERTLASRKMIEKEIREKAGHSIISLGAAELTCIKTENILVELSSDWRADYIANNLPENAGSMSKQEYEVLIEEITENFEDELGTWWTYYVNQLEAILVKAKLCAINVVEEIYEDTDSRSLVEIEIVNSPQVSILEGPEAEVSKEDTVTQFLSRICVVNKNYEHLTDIGW